MKTTNLPSGQVFSTLASDAQIKRTVKALEANNFRVMIAENGADAKKKFFEVFPAEAEVFTANSDTLRNSGISEELDHSGRYRSVRAVLSKMDAKTQNREMQKLGATPEYIAGSVHAITEDGHVIIASKTGSQLAGYVSGAAHVIWVVGTQKIVATLADGMERIEKYSLPLEDVRAFETYGVHSSVDKLLIVNREYRPGRTTIILVKENLGF